MLEGFIDNPRENSLTAAVFAHLLHLPSEMFWQVLSNACYTTKLPKFQGEPKVYPWPSWRTADRDLVIPDLFVRFDKCDLIVEAKRWDNEMQDPAQWRRELSAYNNEYGNESKEVRIL